jgi:ankyrin repeat protein
MGRKVKSRRPELLDAVIEGDRERFDRLLAEGFAVNARDTAGWTALHFAAQRQDVSQIERLLAAGADVDATDGYGNTPLFRAVFCYRGDGSAIAALKAAGADENKLNTSGVSPRSLADSIANYDVASVL